MIVQEIEYIQSQKSKSKINSFENWKYMMNIAIDRMDLYGIEINESNSIFERKLGLAAK